MKCIYMDLIIYAAMVKVNILGNITRSLLCFLVFVYLMQTKYIQEEGTSLEKMSPSDWTVDNSMGHCLD